MARKTLGKMEFETLISDLREQNQTNADYQEESTFLFTHIKNDLSIMSMSMSKQNSLLERYLTANLDKQDLTAEKLDNTNSILMQNYLEQMGDMTDTSEESLKEEKKSSKLLGSLLTLFVRREKEEKRKAAEGLLEKVVKRDSKGNVSFKPGNLLPKKGFLGDLSKGLSSFLSTALLGIAGKGFLGSVLRGITLGSGFAMKFAKGLGLALLAPTIFDALGEAFKQKDFSSGLKTFVDTLFKQDDARSFGENLAKNAGTAAVLGLSVGGIPGAILGGLIGAATVALPKVFGQEDIKPSQLYTKIKDYMSTTLFGSANSGGVLIGGLLGTKLGAGFGPAGMVAGAILGSGVGFLGGTLVKAMERSETEEGELLDIFKDQLKKDILANPAMTMTIGGATVGSLIGAFTPVGMVGGAIIGAGLGYASGSIAKMLEEGGIGYGLRNMFRRFKEAFNELISLNFEEAIRILKGETAVDTVQLEKSKKYSLTGDEMEASKYVTDAANMLGLKFKDDTVEEIKDLREDLLDVRSDMTDVNNSTNKYFQSAIAMFDKMRRDQADDPFPMQLSDSQLYEKVVEDLKLKGMYSAKRSRASDDLKNLVITLPKKEREIEKQLQEKTLKVARVLDTHDYSDKKLKGKSYEIIYGDPNSKRQLETVIRERMEKEDMEKSIGRGSQASAPVSVQDNSIMNYSTTNSLTEIAPMFSGMQYQTALG